MILKWFFFVSLTRSQFAKIIQNPNAAELQKSVNQGRRCTWEKLSAINANCGIELMLDECVSELNRRNRIKRSLERNSLHTSGSIRSPSSGAKRIPSWNCIARENSWGSLDEDGMIETVHTPGGPWSGPAFGSVRSHQPFCDGSDSESENMDTNHHCWTRVGGPLMRTASASLFIQEQGGDHTLHINKEDLKPHENVCDEAEISRLLGPKELSIGRQMNKIFDKALGHLNTKLAVKKFDDSDTEEHECCINSFSTNAELSLDLCNKSSVWAGQTGHYLLQPNDRAGQQIFFP